MIVYLLVAALGFALFLWLVSFGLQRLSLSGRQLAASMLIILLLVALGLLALTGRLHWLAAAIPMGFLLARRLWFTLQYVPLARGLWRWLQSSRNADAAHATENITTDWLIVHLDKQANTLDASVRQGQHRGRRLSELTAAELQALYTELIQDPLSCKILELYMQHQGAQTDSQDVQAVSGKLSREDALKILGLTGRPNQDAIVKAHRRLMQKYHTDRGGSDYLATLINTARDLLLSQL